MSYRIPKTKEAAWKLGVAFIAYNDEPNEMSFKSICGYPTTILMAETFQVSVEKVARAVLRIRRKRDRGQL